MGKFTTTTFEFKYNIENVDNPPEMARPSKSSETRYSRLFYGPYQSENYCRINV